MSPRSELVMIASAAVSIAGSGCLSQGEPPPPNRAERAAWVMERDWIVGGSRELGRVTLESAPWSGAMAPTGDVAVVDRGARRVVVLAEDGELEAVLGSDGSGPGEFQDPWQVGFGPDSFLWVSDASSGRITWFDADGTVVETDTHGWTQVPGSPWSVRGNWALAGGGVLGLAVSSAPPDARSGGAIPLSLWDEEGRLKTIAWIETTVPFHRSIPTSTGLSIGSRQPLDASPVVGVMPGGTEIWVLDRQPPVGHEGTMSLALYDPSGRERREIAVKYRSVRTDRAVYDWLERIAQAYEEQTPPSSGKVRAEDVMEATWIPPWLPPARSVFVDRKGFWVQRERVHPGIWERYNFRGDLDGWVQLPGSFRGLAASECRLVGYERDSLGVAMISSYSSACAGRAMEGDR